MSRSVVASHGVDIRTPWTHSAETPLDEDSYDSGEEKISSPLDRLRTHGSPVNASPMSRKQAILQRQNLDKYTNGSDGESDSGSSTLTEARHDLGPDFEYSWECPSGLSLLLELMTQSPQKLRDVTEAGSERKLYVEYENASEDRHPSLNYARPAELTEMKASLPDAVICDVRLEHVDTSFVEMADRRVYSSARSQVSTSKRSSDQPDIKMYNAQRKIAFDCKNNAQSRQIMSYGLQFSAEEPIDYSQLSSRRREYISEPQHITLNDEETQVKKIKFTENSPSLPKYEFILSPKMDSNGNLILHQPNNSFYSRTASTDHVPARAAVPTAHGLLKEKRSQDSNSVSPVSSSTKQYDDLLSNTCAEPSNSSTVELSYHPKLKFFKAAKLHAKAKQLNKEGQTQDTMPPALGEEIKSVQVSDIISRRTPDIITGNTTAVITRHPKDVIPRNATGVITRQATDKEYCQENHSTKVILLKSQPIFTSESSRGSQLKPHEPEFPLHQSPSSHHPGTCSVSHELYMAEQTADQPLSDQLLSPASLRDQQSTLSELLFSSNRKAGLDPYACSECGKRYSTSSNLARHRQTHRSVCDKKARKCPHCEKVYVSMPAFSMHVRTHNQGCECPHCGKKFSRPWLLQGHIRTHTGEKPFGCPQCGKSFADKSNLRAHIQTHSTDKPYVCGRCGKAFALKSYLYKHEESSCMRGQRFRN